MTIQEAIDTVEEFCKRVTIEMGDSTLLESLQVVAAAARAYSCEPCSGMGQVTKHGAFGPRHIDCPDCAEVRRWLEEHTT